MNPARVSFIRRGLAEALGRTHLPEMEQLRGVEILDVGCGGGLLSEALARLGAKVTSIDPSPENIAVAQKHSQLDPTGVAANSSYSCTTVEELHAIGSTFDAVCALEVLEHVDNPLAFVGACKGCVRPGGSLFVSTINRTAKSYALTILGAEYVMRLLPVGTHDWHKFVTPQELIAMVSAGQRGAQKVDVKGLVLSVQAVPSVRWALSPDDHDVNYIAHFTLDE